MNNHDRKTIQKMIEHCNHIKTDKFQIVFFKC